MLRVPSCASEITGTVRLSLLVVEALVSQATDQRSQP